MLRRTTCPEMEERDGERAEGFVLPPEGTMAAAVEEEPVVWPKVVTARAASPELSATEFFEEMREFMR